MAAAVQLTEDTAHRLAPDDSTLTSARDLVRQRKFGKLGVSADGTWVLANCKGSGKEPYQVSVDLGDPDNPLCRCNCPSRKFPCKHGVGLILLYAQSPDQFGEQEPAEDLPSKRENKAARAEKAATAPAKPKKVNVAALAKKATAQRDGLDLLEKLLIDMVNAGQWYEDSRLDKLERQSKQLIDAYLNGAAVMLNRLVLVGRREDIDDEERLALGADLIGQLWATVQKGRNYLENKIAGDESQSEADAVIEDVIGKVWQLGELKEKGYFRSDLSLLELAYERYDDQAKEQRIEI